MGCDWTFCIQARYHDTWVTVYSFDSKTRCGGYPIREGLRVVAQDLGVKGSYGVEYPTDTPFIVENEEIYEEGYDKNVQKLENLAKQFNSKGHQVLEKIPDKPKNDSEVMLSPSEVMAERQKLNKLIKDVEDKHVQAGKIGYNPAHHCFLLSISEYKTLIQSMNPTEHPSYLEMLRPISKWAEMMKTADLSDESPWMDDTEEFVTNITQDIEGLQAKRHRDMMQTFSSVDMVSAKFGLPLDVVMRLREYLAAAVAKDMRIAIYDCEQNSRKIREGDYTEACAIM